MGQRCGMLFLLSVSKEMHPSFLRPFHIPEMPLIVITRSLAISAANGKIHKQSNLYHDFLLHLYSQ